MADKIEMATVSSRGQICIPNDIRDEMGLKEGSKILFALTGDSLIMKKVSMETFAEITRPLKEAMKKSDLKESDVNDIIHRFRAEKRARKENSK
ncbi:MAG: AbrB/MazE/SpoVT family DNA-binding domain-containing protein [Nanoarchaeota archaeon]